jgi:ribosomal protein S18 acetylase RimI-like enzyme
MRLRWGGPTQVMNGEVYRPADLPGYVAEIAGERVGYVCLRVLGDRCEVGLLDAVRPKVGVGGALIEAAVTGARERGCRTLVAVTTNDNRNAQAFYEHLGFRLREVRPGAVTEGRKLKPSISLTGEDGTPITDELEYELSLEPAGGAT